jgi:hypothetical protein
MPASQTTWFSSLKVVLNIALAKDGGSPEIAERSSRFGYTGRRAASDNEAESGDDSDRADHRFTQEPWLKWLKRRDLIHSLPEPFKN